MPKKLIPLGSNVRQQTGGISGVNFTGYLQNYLPVPFQYALGESKELFLQKRPGYNTLIAAPQTGYLMTAGMQWTGLPGTNANFTTRGVFVYAQDKASTDMKLYKYDSSETLLGTFGTADYRCIGMQETLISGVANLTLNVRKTSSPYDQKALYFPNGGALTEIVSANFPATTIGRGVHLDGYYFMASTDGYIYNSDINSLANWSANSRIAVQMAPDSLVSLEKLGTNIVAFGTKSIEFFANNGNPTGSPLVSVGTPILDVGAIHSALIYKAESGIIFGAISTSGTGVHLLTAGGLKDITIPYMAYLTGKLSAFAADSPIRGGLTTIAAGSMAIIGSAKYWGVEWILFNMRGTILAYSIALDIWVTLVLPATSGDSVAAFSLSGLQILINDTGMLYAADPISTTSGNDYNATAMTAVVQTPSMTMGVVNRKFYNSVKVIGDKANATSNVVVSYSDDQGVNFVTAGTIDMSVSPPVMLKGLGSSYERIWKLSHSSAAASALRALELDYTVGTS